MSDTSSARAQAMVGPEAFQAWLDDPVTRWVRQAAETLAQHRQEMWVQASWEGAACDPTLLHQLRGQADAHRWLAHCSYAEVCDANDQELIAE